MPVTLRLPVDLLPILRDGARRTPHKQQDLMRLTLRRHLPAVIEAEATAAAGAPLTNLKPWPKGTLEAAYRRTRREDEAMESAAMKARKAPEMED